MATLHPPCPLHSPHSRHRILAEAEASTIFGVLDSLQVYVDTSIYSKESNEMAPALAATRADAFRRLEAYFSGYPVTNKNIHATLDVVFVNYHDMCKRLLCPFND